MEKITKLQSIFLQKVCFLLFIQLLILLAIVAIVHKFFPKQVCFMTCRFWLDFFVYMIFIIALVYTSHSQKVNIIVRYAAFFGISILLAYIMALQYNLVSLLKNKKDQETAKTFFKALVIVISIFVINLLLLPITMKYMNFIYTVSTSLFICLIGLILWGLFVGKGFLIWVSVSLFVFLGLLLTDLNILVHRCKKPNSVQCDPLNGASLLYVDLINILQQIFILLNAEQG